MKYDFKDNTFLCTPKGDVKDKIDVEIGDSKQPDIFLPQVKIMRWDNEVNCSIRLKNNNFPIIKKDGDKIKWETQSMDAHFYPVTEDEGGQEFEIILKEPPKTNVIEFSLQTKGLDFFYQPPLTQEEINKGDFRSENVVGSYAVYASENKINYVGGKEYKCGKVGHIFRPKIIDALGKEAWGELHIENGILSVTIPQDFLDKAVYPVRHAAGLTFGYTTLGQAGFYSSTGYILGTYESFSPASNGTLNSISAYGADISNSAYKYAIYNGTSLVDTCTEGHWPTIGAYSPQNVITGASVYSSSSYYIVFRTAAAGASWVPYDTTSNYLRYVASTYTDAWPASVTWSYSGSRKFSFSIYATYEASGGGVTRLLGQRSMMGIGS